MKSQIEQLLQFGFESLGSGDFTQACLALESARASLSALPRQSEEERAQLAIVLVYLGKACAGAERADPEPAPGEESSPLSKAEVYLLQALKMTDGCGEFLPIELLARLFLGEFYLEKACYVQALSQFEGSYSLAGLLEDLVSMELSAGQLGTVCLSLGKLEASFDWFLLALELAGKIERKHKANLPARENLAVETPVSLPKSNKSIWLGSLGLCSTELGQYDKAVDYYQRACLEAELAGDKITMSVCLGSKGNCQFEREEYQAARSSFSQARELAFAGGDRRRSGIWLGNEGIASLRLRELAPAYEALQKALEIARQEGDLRSLASHLDSLSEYYKECGEKDLAQGALEEALALARQIGDEPSERIYLNHFGSLKLAHGELAPAFEYFRQAIDLFERQRAHITADDLKTSFANKGSALYQEMIATCFALGRREEALEYVGRAKSRALIDLLANTPIDISELEGADDKDIQALKQKEARLRAAITSLERLLLRDAQNFADAGETGKNEYSDADTNTGTRRAPHSRGDSRQLYGQWQEVVNQLKRRHPHYASLIATSTMNFSEMEDLWRRQLLACDTAILEFYFSPSFFCCAFLYQPNLEEKPLFLTHYIENKEELAQLENDLNCFWEMSSTEGWEVPLSLSKRLYAQLLGAVSETLAAQNSLKRLLIVPHGALYNLPFAALHNGKQYLCQSLAVSYLPAISLIPLLKKTGAAPSAVSSACRYLVSAISDYSVTRQSGRQCPSLLRGGLEDLSFTLDEARSIVGLSRAQKSEATLLTNEEVRQGLLEMFGQFEIVHFAGHAVFNPDEPLASGLVLSDGSILSAAAILEGNVLRTSKGRLLVLSACQTGVNRITRGGEILGLARALIYAGMPNLLLSLWEVSDRSTADLMADFYSRWQVGKISVAEALRQAQERALAAKLPLHAWAPFIHFGLE